jgi:hypothetical protein
MNGNITIYIYNQLWEMVAKIEDMKSIPSRIEVLSKIEVYSTLKYSGNIYIYHVLRFNP